MPPTAFPLHQIALQAARRLPRRAFAVAVTGSVARGNWHAASDVDLWVLGPRNAHIHAYVRGHPVMYLMETLQEAGSFLRLCRCEVPDIWVLHDPAGHLAAIKERAIRERSRIKRAVTRATIRALLDAVERGSQGSAARQVCWLREAAWRAAALEAWQCKGWHTPKFRHLSRMLDPFSVIQLKTILGVPWPRAAWKALQERWPPFVRAYARGRRAQSLPPILKDPGFLFSQAEQGIPVDAVLEGRKALEAYLPDEVWTALQDGLEPTSPQLDLPKGLAAAWMALQGFVPSAPRPLDARKVRGALARLLKRLDTSRHLTGRLERRRWRAHSFLRSAPSRPLKKSPVAALCERRPRRVHGKTAVTDRRYSFKRVFQRAAGRMGLENRRER